MSSTNANVQAAMDAKTNLHVFGAVVSILEGGSLAGGSSDASAKKIIAMCQAEQQRQLRAMDKALKKEGVNAY